MGVRDSKRWREDVDLALCSVDGIGATDGSTVVVTGGAGLLLSPVVDMLARRNEITGAGTRILCAGRWPSEVERRFGVHAASRGIEWVPYNATDPDVRLPSCDFVIHGASNADPAAIVSDPVGTLLSNVNGVGRLLEHAKSCRARLLYVSSSEVYGTGLAGPYSENDCGSISLLNPRSSYPQGKRAAETLCASYMSQYGTDIVIVRPGHIYGPTASLHDSRVASAWMWRAARGEDIFMRSDGSQVRSWCHCLDCATAVLTVLMHGEPGNAYNLGNPESAGSIANLGEILAEVGGVRLVREFATDKQKAAFNPMSDSSLNVTKLLSLGWSGTWGLREGVEQSIAVIRESIAARNEVS